MGDYFSNITSTMRTIEDGQAGASRAAARAGRLIDFGPIKIQKPEFLLTDRDRQAQKLPELMEKQLKAMEEAIRQAEEAMTNFVSRG